MTPPRTTPQEWEKIKAIFSQLLDAPGEHRAALLAQLCPEDGSLKAKLAELLANHDESRASEPAEPGPQPLIGDGALLGGRFRVERKLGSGGFGDVFRVLDTGRNARVALKILRSFEPGAVFRFKREFRALASVRHRNIVQLYELLQAGDQWMYTMELVEGCHWLEFVRTPTPHSGFAEANLRDAMSQLAAGLAALHRHGLLHRDIKPSNVMVDRDGRLVLLDFGLVRDLTAAPSRTLAGTPEYMSPEQAAGKTLRPASDWYSAGVLLYQALTGTSPHKGSLLNMVFSKQNEVPLAPAVINPAAPPDLSDLCMALLEADPARRPGEEKILAALDAAGDLPAHAEESSGFRGREAELAELEECFRRARTGAPVVVQLAGPSGIGKSSLVAQFLRRTARLHPRTMLVTGRCFASESVPYQGIDDLVDNLTTQLLQLPEEERVRFLPDRFDELARIFPVLSRLAAVHPPRTADPVELRRRALGALREMLTRIADRRGLVAVLDDLQWAGADSSAALRELLDEAEKPAGMFVLAYRPEAASDGGPVAAMLGALKDSAGILLSPFSRDEARDLAAWLGRDLPGREDTLRTLADESGGDPFLLRQAVQSLEASPQANVTIEGLLQRRIGELPARDRRLLEWVALSGRPVEVDVLSAVDGNPEPVLAAVSGLVSLRFIRRQTAGSQHFVDIYHDRIRSAVLAGMPADTIPRHHLALARAVESILPEDADRLAFHYERAGAGSMAVRHLLEAAERAAAALAFDRAAQLFRLVLGLEGVTVEQRRRVLQSLGQALSNRGRGPEAAQCLLEAAALAPGNDRPRLRAAAANQLLRSGHFVTGEKLLSEVLGEVGLRVPKTRRGLELAIVKEHLALKLSPLRFWRRGVAPSAEFLNHIDICGAATIGLGMIDPVRSAFYSARFVRLARASGDRRLTALALASEAAQRSYGDKGRGEKSAELLQQAQSLAERVGDPHALGHVRVMSGIAEFVLGNFERAASETDQALDILRGVSAGAAWEAATARIIGLSARTITGHWRENRQRLPELLADARDRGDLYASVGLRLLGSQC